eukprot:m.411440 g.411440  ORF g.411440 m.411440 type:complete len:54 (+) comp28655_c0_seq1:206-367(+)
MSHATSIKYGYQNVSAYRIQLQRRWSLRPLLATDTLRGDDPIPKSTRRAGVLS